MTARLKPDSDGYAPDHAACSEVVGNLVERWELVETAGMEFARCESLDLENPHAQRTVEDQMSVALAREQLAVLAGLSSVPAQNLDDILAKLSVWVALVCPTPGDAAHLEPADQLVLCVYQDLCRFGR